MYHMEYAYVTPLAILEYYRDIHPFPAYLLLVYTIFEEYLIFIWSLLVSYSVNILVVCAVYVIINYIFYRKYFNNDKVKEDNWSHRKLSGCGRVLFVIAHPDDECMFFGPTIVSLVKSYVKVYLVCLSIGDMYGRGKERKKELWSSCETLGIDSSSIWLYNHDELQDDPKVEWRDELVASLILRTVETLDIDAVITFDKRGVSGHKNHTSIYQAMSFLRSRKSLPRDCKVYLLETVSLLRKFSFYADIILSVVSYKRYFYITDIKNHNVIISAMAKHVSQYVWYRKLFMMFSRYTYVNTLTNFIG